MQDLEDLCGSTFYSPRTKKQTKQRCAPLRPATTACSPWGAIASALTASLVSILRLSRGANRLCNGIVISSPMVLPTSLAAVEGVRVSRADQYPSRDGALNS